MLSTLCRLGITCWDEKPLKNMCSLSPRFEWWNFKQREADSPPLTHGCSNMPFQLHLHAASLFKETGSRLSGTRRTIPSHPADKCAIINNSEILIAGTRKFHTYPLNFAFSFLFSSRGLDGKATSKLGPEHFEEKYLVTTQPWSFINRNPRNLILYAFRYAHKSNLKKCTFNFFP